jgi:hypothetical protein
VIEIAAAKVLNAVSTPEAELRPEPEQAILELRGLNRDPERSCCIKGTPR